MFQIQIHNLIDNSKCYQVVREIRWPDEAQCSHCSRLEVIKKGFDETETGRQRYQCKHCTKHFDDLTGRFFSVEYRIYDRFEQRGYLHKTVSYGNGEFARDEDGDGFHEVHVNTIKGL